ncbi:MAG: DctP family TRAP transporter solute-binding subunit [Leucobacter sp.]
MNRYLATATALLCVVGLAACTSQPGSAESHSNDENYTWDMSITTSETSAWWAGSEKFAELLNEGSDGRIDVTVFANETLSSGDTSAGIEQLMEGAKALSYTSAIQYSSFDDRFSAIAAPFLFSNYEEVDSVLEDPEVQQAYSDLLEEMGIKFLGFAENGFRHFSSNVREVRSPEDLNGQKLRVPGSPLTLDIFNSFGSDPVVMSFNELFTSLQNGTVDGHENSIDLINSGGLDEVTEYLSISNYVFDPLILSMNLDLYNSLSDQDQQLLEEAAAEANAYEIEFIREREAEQLVEIKENISVVELTDEELASFREFVQPIYDTWESKWTPELAAAVQPK